MTSIGETLRSERLRLRLDLEQVAEKTKIGKRLLQAIEADDFDKLPGGLLTRSFVKQYARVLGLDEEAIGAQFRTIENRHEESPVPVKGLRSETKIPSITSDHGAPRIPRLDPKSRSMLVSAGWAALAIGVCAGGYYLMNHERFVAPVAEVVAPIAEVVAPVVKNESVAVQARVETAPNPPNPTGAVQTQPAPASTGVVEVLLKASEDSWISVTADGRRQFQGILQANDSKQIDANEKVKVVAGNSGGLEIALNGRSIGPIGRSGQIRTVELTSEGAHVLRPTSPATDPLL